MPMYQFECPHGHTFEKVVPMDKRRDPIPCEGTVNQLVSDDELEAMEVLPTRELPEDMEWVSLEDAGEGLSPTAPVGESRFLARKVPCILKATMVVTHASPKSMVNHRLGANRDAAREGRYDPLSPVKGIGKGSKWRP